MSSPLGRRRGPRLRLTSAELSDLDVDALVIITSRATDGTVRLHGEGLSGRTAALIRRQLLAVGADGGAGSRARLPAPPRFATRSVLCLGVSEAAIAAQGADGALQDALADGLRAVGPSERVAIVVPSTSLVYPLALAAALAGQPVGPDPGGRRHRLAARPIDVWVDDATTVARHELRRAQTVGDAVRWARDLVNEPPNQLPPEELGRQVIAAFAGSPVAAAVLDQDELRRLGCAGTLAVGSGSSSPPILIRLEYVPDRARAHLALVGKGVTFDSGGISIKSAAGMHEMKSDMAGGAAVVAAVAAIAALRLPVAVRAFVPCAENMPDGRALRPGDVLRMANGTSVEVLNTDAEGRLLLADALILASEQSPDAIVDVATLTSAQMIALGTRTGAVLANDEQLRDSVCAAAADAIESMWPMPIPAHMRSLLASDTADLANVGGMHGAMLISAAFLREFVPDDQPWAHLDIAGPAFSTDAPRGTTPTGGTGFGVATLIELARRLSSRDDRALDAS